MRRNSGRHPNMHRRDMPAFDHVAHVTSHRPMPIAAQRTRRAFSLPVDCWTRNDGRGPPPRMDGDGDSDRWPPTRQPAIGLRSGRGRGHAARRTPAGQSRQRRPGPADRRDRTARRHPAASGRTGQPRFAVKGSGMRMGGGPQQFGVRCRAGCRNSTRWPRSSSSPPCRHTSGSRSRTMRSTPRCSRRWAASPLSSTENCSLSRFRSRRRYEPAASWSRPSWR